MNNFMMNNSFSFAYLLLLSVIVADADCLLDVT